MVKDNFIIVALVGIMLISSWKWFLLLLYAPYMRRKNLKDLIKWRNAPNPIIQNGYLGIGKLNKYWVVKGALIKVLSFYLTPFWSFSRFIDLEIGKIPSFVIRDFLYKHLFLLDKEKDAIIHYGAEIRDHYKLKIGKGSIIGDKALLDARNGIIIGRNVNFSSNVSIYTEQHDHRDPNFACNSDDSFCVQIDDHAWIGPNVVILHSVHIGEGAVIAAGAVVTQNVPPFAIMAGIPAKMIGEKNRNLKYEFRDINNYFY